MYDIHEEDDEQEIDELDWRDEFDEDVLFESPGSSLRKVTADNPRCHPCPQCHAEDALTLLDVRQHYVCDRCADSNERGW
jgi:hypothetical protein